jgi:hypothetical protein
MRNMLKANCVAASEKLLKFCNLLAFLIDAFAHQNHFSSQDKK